MHVIVFNCTLLKYHESCSHASSSLILCYIQSCLQLNCSKLACKYLAINTIESQGSSQVIRIHPLWSLLMSVCCGHPYNTSNWWIDQLTDRQTVTAFHKATQLAWLKTVLVKATGWPAWSTALSPRLKANPDIRGITTEHFTALCFKYLILAGSAQRSHGH